MIKVNKMTNAMDKFSRVFFLNSWHSKKKDLNIYGRIQFRAKEKS